MHSKNNKIMLGLFILVVGVLLLLNNFRLFQIDDELWWGIAFITLGIVFINVHRRNTIKKGPLVVGIIFLILGTFSILDSIRIVTNDIIGVFFLWGLAVIFFSIYIRHNRQWWAIIPGGAALILGFLVLFEEFRILDNEYFGFIFLFGMSLVFWFLYLIREDKNKFGWAQIVAIILMIVSFFVLSEEFDSQVTDVLFPASIIVCGGYFIFRGLLTGKKTTE
ncbi:hypothetical protein H8E88_14410 [candidate division KSB1 bacterium]|nr:hypothetical protein [candidate division KSB1 bacterium]MBL7094821.1 hypothetical protein [candidate division KSB1 bacterium]